MFWAVLAELNNDRMIDLQDCRQKAVREQCQHGLGISDLGHCKSGTEHPAGNIVVFAGVGLERA